MMDLESLKAENASLRNRVERLEGIARAIVDDVSCIDNPDRLSPRTVWNIVYEARAALTGEHNG